MTQRGKWERPTLAQRFATKYVKADDGCWLWVGARFHNGYGVIWSEGRMVYAHRVSYVLHKTAIPQGMTVDHTCHNTDASCEGGRACSHRRCVNPAHLELVTAAENTTRGFARRTHCKRGHEYTPETTRLSREGWRVCLVCENAGQRRRYYARTAA